jgi:hypothetical protein
MTNMRRRQLPPLVSMVIGLGLAIGCGSSSSTPSNVSDGGGGAGGGSADASGGSADVPVNNTPDSGGTIRFDGGGGVGNLFKCAPSGGGGGGAGACTKAETDAYYACAATKCAPAFAPCIGASFGSNGQIGGTCGPYLNCVNACACGDFNCQLACGNALECLSCLGNASNMCQASCSAPACLTGPDAGVPSFDGNFTFPDVSFSIPDLGASGGTCADLKACCDAMTDASGKSDCNSAYGFVKDQGDSACGSLLSSYRSNGTCH